MCFCIPATKCGTSTSAAGRSILLIFQEVMVQYLYRTGKKNKTCVLGSQIPVLKQVTENVFYIKQIIKSKTTFRTVPTNAEVVLK